jgi:hypothetical protein
MRARDCAHSSNLLHTLADDDDYEDNLRRLVTWYSLAGGIMDIMGIYDDYDYDDYGAVDDDDDGAAAATHMQFTVGGEPAVSNEEIEERAAAYDGAGPAAAAADAHVRPENVLNLGMPNIKFMQVTRLLNRHWRQYEMGTCVEMAAEPLRIELTYARLPHLWTELANAFRTQEAGVPTIMLADGHGHTTVEPDADEDRHEPAAGVNEERDAERAMKTAVIPMQYGDAPRVFYLIGTPLPPDDQWHRERFFREMARTFYTIPPPPPEYEYVPVHGHAGAAWPYTIRVPLQRARAAARRQAVAGGALAHSCRAAALKRARPPPPPRPRAPPPPSRRQQRGVRGGWIKSRRAPPRRT